VSDIDPHRSLLDDQIRYYQARANEYDDWFFRRGRWDRGQELNEHWFNEVEQVRAELQRFNPKGNVLEIACGTGLWTEYLVHYADRVTALDAVPEVIKINRARVNSPNVHYLQADIFAWQPEERYDVVFFGFWLSHVPPALFKSFWNLVGTALKPDGRVFFVDSGYNPASTAKDHQLEGKESTMVNRRLNDGREFRIVKIFYQPAALTRQLAEMGWDFHIAQTPAYFIYGRGSCAKEKG
jgi:2-polyprenyl-3-methyl-5-hydroxy-6-metoxy-1,4-benzoquinol methylase